MKNIYPLVLKPTLDRVFSFILIIILSPFFITATILLFILNNGKPFFIQWRPGKNEKLFQIIKFKTMNDKTDSQGQLLPDSNRLTSVGNLLRKLSLDELPQLFNILKGDMSFIGPRPFLPIYLPFYSQIEKKRHIVRPGITGYAQVNGRNILKWDQKLQYDVYYVDHLSFILDLKILFKTAYKVLFSKDVSVDASQIQPPLHIVRQSNTKTPNT